MQSDGSRVNCKIWQQQEGRTCGVKQAASEGPSLFCMGQNMFSIILLSPTTTGPRGRPRTDLASLTNLSLFVSAVEKILLPQETTSLKRGDATRESKNSKRPEPPQQIESALSFLIVLHCICIFSNTHWGAERLCMLLVRYRNNDDILYSALWKWASTQCVWFPQQQVYSVPLLSWITRWAPTLFPTQCSASFVISLYSS